MHAEFRGAIAASHLRSVPTGLLAQLLDHARQQQIPAGAVTHRVGEGRRHLELVVTGGIRVFVTAPDGRMMTIRYCRAGALLGAMSLFTPRFAMPAATQTLIDTRLLCFSPEVVRSLIDHRPVAEALLAELSERARDFLHEIAGGTFGTVRQRVVRHLLDLASERAAGLDASGSPQRELTAFVSQQELADAAGTVREVIVRILRELRREDLVSTGRNRIILLDPARMIAEAEWNLSS